MKWSDVIDAANPANVPRQVFYREETFMPLEPITRAQLDYLAPLLREVGDDPEVLFGAGFESLDALSSWAASWAITILRDRRALREHADREAKRLAGVLMRQRMEELPVHRCAKCGEDRPHRVVSAVLICEACKAVSE